MRTYVHFVLLAMGNQTLCMQFVFDILQGSEDVSWCTCTFCNYKIPKHIPTCLHVGMCLGILQFATICAISRMEKISQFHGGPQSKYKLWSWSPWSNPVTDIHKHTHTSFRSAPFKQVTQHNFNWLYQFVYGFIFITLDIMWKPVYLSFHWYVIYCDWFAGTWAGWVTWGQC